MHATELLMSIRTGVPVSEGLTALAEEQPRRARRRRTYTRRATESGAVGLTVPPLLPVSDLAVLDVYQNCPQLALDSSALDVAAAGAGQTAQEAVIVLVKHEYIYQCVADRLREHPPHPLRRAVLHLPPSGGPVSTSCVGFGVEQWLEALAVHSDGNRDRARGAVDKAEKSLA